MYFKVFTILLYLFCTWTWASAQKFLPDDPLTIDQDDLADVGEPRSRGLSDYYDFLQHTFMTPGNLSKKTALNINTLGEVPDSSWFQNRHGQRRMTIEQLVRGPNSGDGPSRDGKWVVTQAKTEGITPGFRIRDPHGDIYVIKFDPLSNPEMATAADVISAKFFFAAGYNVPENYLAFFGRDELTVDPDATISVGLGPPRRMTESDLDQILSRVYKTPDDRYRAVASKLLAGRPIGPFKYYGTRSDDPNDVIPHEQRRELRGLRVLSAWLNHDDSRAINTLDTVITENGPKYIRHYLIDFGSTLGSGSVGAQKPRAGWEYIWEPAPVFRRILTLGLWDSSWIRIPYPDLPSIGRFESTVFDPDQWKPEYPNPAFMNALPDDSYWAAKIVMAFSDDDIRAVVRTGGLTDQKAEQYLIQTLIERRDKIGRHYINGVLSTDHFKVNNGRLESEHLASLYGFAQRPSKYALAWFKFDNEKETKIPLGAESTVEGSAFPIPEDFLNDTAPYFGVDVWADDGHGQTDKSRKISIFLNRSATLRIVGIERSWTGR
jgi:hypothetical protein